MKTTLWVMLATAAIFIINILLLTNANAWGNPDPVDQFEAEWQSFDTQFGSDHTYHLPYSIPNHTGAENYYFPGQRPILTTPSHTGGRYFYDLNHPAWNPR